MKQRMKRLMRFSLFMALIFSACFCLLAEKVPPAVLQAAQCGLNDLPLELSAKTGLENPKLQFGFQVYTAAPESLLEGSRLSAVLSPTGLWRLVIVKEDKPVSLLTVAQVEGRWTAVAVGGAQLAVEIGKVMEQWPAKKGYNHRFVRVYQSRTDLIEISRGSRVIGFVPMTASRMVFGMSGEFDAKVLLQDAEILPYLQEAAVETINKLNNPNEK